MSADVKMQVCLQFNGDWPNGKAPAYVGDIAIIRSTGSQYQNMSADVKMQVCLQFNGDWPSGKAPVFGTGIRGFESLIPSHKHFEYVSSLKVLFIQYIRHDKM